MKHEFSRLAYRKKKIKAKQFNGKMIDGENNVDNSWRRSQAIWNEKFRFLADLFGSRR